MPTLQVQLLWEDPRSCLKGPAGEPLLASETLDRVATEGLEKGMDGFLRQKPGFEVQLPLPCVWPWANDLATCFLNVPD